MMIKYVCWMRLCPAIPASQRLRTANRIAMARYPRILSENPDGEVDRVRRRAHRHGVFPLPPLRVLSATGQRVQDTAGYKNAKANYRALHGLPQIEDVKKRVEEKEGILPAQQRLIYAGKQMHDDVKLGEGGVVPDATLHLVLTLRGGADLERH
ncbi:hypothetical protein GGR51DRAFT_562163 [Nemania sp. FL0031]|nr:hypothetical protein GGR51DRAFT_562163 [Nemania sp. FL0031]